MKHYDWEMIRNMYEMGSDEVTLGALASKKGYPSINTLKKRSGSEGWPELRAQYRHQVDTKTREIASTDEADIRSRHIHMAQDMQEKALAALEKLDPDELSPAELRRFLVAACEIERRAAGILNVAGLDIDVKKLSDEELEEMIAGRWPRSIPKRRLA